MSVPTRVPVETHGSPNGHQLPSHTPNLLHVRLRKGQVVGPDQLKFDQLEAVRVVLVLVPLQGGLHDIIVLGAEFIVGAF